LGWARFGVRALRIAEVKVAEGPAWGEAAVLLAAGVWAARGMRRACAEYELQQGVAGICAVGS
jgi:hypothetical protein